MDKSLIEQMLRKQVIIDGTYEIQPDGLVNVDGDVHYRTSINKITVQFGKVSGNFSRDRNVAQDPRLTTLLGFPNHVDGSVSVARSRVTDLSHGPSHVGGSFYCYTCDNLTSLQGAPTYVGGNFMAFKCQLTSLQGAPRVIKGGFDVGENPLENYDHLPEVCASLIVPYIKHAPILRLLVYPEVQFRFNPAQEPYSSVKEIMHKYAGQGKPGAIRAAAELIRAGYKENARW